VVEQAAVNRPVGGSNPSLGAILQKSDLKVPRTAAKHWRVATMRRRAVDSETVGGRSFPEGSTSTDLTAFAEAGLSFDLGSALELVPPYRYQWIDDGRDGFDDSGIHVARLGLRYWFN
jgi:hypothetical protein